MKTAQVYENQFSGERFDTPGDCLRSEFWHLRDRAVFGLKHLILNDTVDLDDQFEKLWERLKSLRDKGREYKALKSSERIAGAASNVVPLKKAA